MDKVDYEQYDKVIKDLKKREIKGKIIAIDFDGTITRDYKFPDNIGTLRDGCKDAIDYIRKNNRVVLWSCRNGKHLDQAINFLKENGIEVDAINKDLTDISSNGKIFADIYIDDRNIFCKEINWLEIKAFFEGK